MSERPDCAHREHMHSSHLVLPSTPFPSFYSCLLVSSLLPCPPLPFTPTQPSLPSLPTLPPQAAPRTPRGSLVEEQSHL